MQTEKSINVAIFGLSLRVLNDLKEKIQQQINVNWTSIADPELEVLMVSDAFIDSPSIQSLIKKDGLRTLKLINNNTKVNIIEDNVLYLPLLEISKLEYWLKSPYVKSQSMATASHETPTTHTASNQTQSTLTAQNHHKNIADVLKEINDPKSGNIKVFDEKGMIAFADPRSDWVWVEDSQKERITNTSLNSIYATRNDMTACITSIKRKNMKNWLWNLLWRSPDFTQLLSSQDEYFYLKYWPQPEVKSERQDILRMSACFAQGASISVVAKQLDLPETRVQRFIAACIGVDFVDRISKTEAKYKPQGSADEDTGFMRKFFGKLRSRLGF